MESRESGIESDNQKVLLIAMRIKQDCRGVKEVVEVKGVLSGGL